VAAESNKRRDALEEPRDDVRGELQTLAGVRAELKAERRSSRGAVLDLLPTTRGVA
jgi:hypothetical protein